MADWAKAPANEPATKRSEMPKSRLQPLPTFIAHFIYNMQHSKQSNIILWALTFSITLTTGIGFCYKIGLVIYYKYHVA